MKKTLAAVISLAAVLCLGTVALAAPALSAFVPGTPKFDYAAVTDAWFADKDAGVTVSAVTSGGYENSAAVKFSGLQGKDWGHVNFAQEAYQSTWDAITTHNDGFGFYLKNETAGDGWVYFKVRTTIIASGGQSGMATFTAVPHFYNLDGTKGQVTDNEDGTYSVPGGFEGFVVVPATTDQSFLSQSATPGWKIDAGQEAAVSQMVNAGKNGPGDFHFAQITLIFGHNAAESDTVSLVYDHFFNFTGDMPDYVPTPDATQKPGKVGDASLLAPVLLAASAIVSLGGVAVARGRKN